MKLEKAKNEFTKFVSQYDMENKKIKRKYGHSYRVMENAGRIAESLKLSNEEIELSKLIGLLHDIGRFEQERIYKTFKDHESIDHGDLGVEILKKDNYIRKYIEEDKYDDIILKAIKNHNKLYIEEGLTKQELLFSKIVRDADKLDIFYEGVEMFWTNKEEIEEVNKSKLSDKAIETFNKNNLMDRKNIITEADKVLNFIGFMFVDENFRGHRLSEKLIDAACDVARSQGYSRIYLMTGEIGLYEKYGFEKQGNLKTLYDTEDQLFSKELKPKKKVVVVPYDETWKQNFIDIRNELADALGELAESIEHVGSTSVEGLSAKPIIDIDVVIKDRTMLDKVIEALEKIGYRHEGDQGIPGREAFKYEDKDHLMKHHLYVCAEDANELKRHMAFRDYLRSHPEAVKEYSRVKTEGAKLYPEDIDSYIEYKAPFIEGIYKVIGF